MKEDLTTKIENWLNTQGYNLEMLTARTFQNKGFRVAQSIYYYDSDNNQPREIDLVCYYSKTILGVNFHMTFVVECKKSNEKPWLVFKSNKQLKKYLRLEEIEGTANGSVLMQEVAKRKNRKKNLKISLFDYETCVFGHGVTQAFTSGPDTTYSATTNVLKAIRYFVEKYAKKNKVKLFSLYFPVIVIDGRLFDVELLETNQPKIEEVSTSKFIQIRSDLNKSSIIQVATKDHLDDFCEDLKKQCELFFKLYTKELKRIADENPYSDFLSNA